MLLVIPTRWISSPHAAIGPSGRVAVVDLRDGSDSAATAALVRERLGSDEDLRETAAASGPALALACLAALERLASPTSALGPRSGAPAFAISVGGAVVRGLPTAARATLTSRVPLRDEVSEAQFGGEFAAAFARTLDALVVVGAASPAEVLVIVRAAGDVAVVPAPPAVRAATSTTARALAVAAHLGRSAHVLTTGPAAEAGVPFANLASFSGVPPDGGAGEPASFVGRGGLGAAFARQGVPAVAVEAWAAPPAADEVPAVSAVEIRRRLLRSPRLLERAAGGTLELAAVGRDDGTSDPPEGPREKHGCRGCPTPCGWRFDLGDRPVNARYSALEGGRLALVERCNALGLDARSIVDLLRGRGGVPTVDQALFRAVDRIVAEGAGVERLASNPRAPLHGADLAARVGIAFASRGPEPVRSLSVFGLSSQERVLTLAGFTATGEPDYDAGALAWWHERFAAAVDVSGFCAFSAAGILADGVASLDELAGWLTGWSNSAAGDGTLALGERWLQLGARHVELHGALREGAAPSAPEALPASAVRGYLTARGGQSAVAGASSSALAGPARGAPVPDRRPAGSGGSGRPRGEGDGSESPVGAGADAGPSPHVRVVLTGALAARWRRSGNLGPAAPGGTLELDVAAGGPSVLHLLRTLCRTTPEVRPWLLGPGEVMVPGVVRDGRIVDAGTALTDGDVLELIVVVPGG